MGEGGSQWIIALARDISARLTAEAELRVSQEALHEAERVVAIADDRERIARDLHDKVIQRLFASGLNLQAIVGTADDRIRPRIESTIDSLDDTIRELRMAIFSLQGLERASGGVRGQILDVVRDAATALGFAPRLQFEGPVESIADHIAAQLVPTLREALSNVARHAAASSVQILVEAADSVTIEVVDDGVGLIDSTRGAGHGLVNLESRARELGGAFEAVSQRTGGVRVRWSVPTQTATVDIGT
jgi:signal transduction histidine kinase